MLRIQLEHRAEIDERIQATERRAQDTQVRVLNEDAEASTRAASTTARVARSERGMIREWQKKNLRQTKARKENKELDAEQQERGPFISSGRRSRRGGNCEETMRKPTKKARNDWRSKRVKVRKKHEGGVEQK